MIIDYKSNFIYLVKTKNDVTCNACNECNVLKLILILILFYLFSEN